MSNMVGNENGIALWNLMAMSNYQEEKDYFVRLNVAASKFGTVWFTDIITQQENKNNQTTWQLSWNHDNNNWNISNFHTPEYAKEVTQRIKDFRYKEIAVIEIDVNDILTE